MKKYRGIFLKELNLSKEPYPFYDTNNLSKYLLKGYVNIVFLLLLQCRESPNVGGIGVCLSIR